MRQERRVDWPLILGPGAPRPVPAAARDTSGVMSVLAAMDELVAYPDVDTILRRTVELARDRIGIERAAIFLVDEDRDVMRGTWGTGARGETTDEHHLVFEMSRADRQALRRARSGAPRWTLFTDCPMVAEVEDQTLLLGYGWVAQTPIHRRQGPSGVLFNDAALTGAPMDEARQVRLAVLCSMVGQFLDLREQTGSAAARVFQGTSRSSHPVVARALALLSEDPALDGKALGKRLGMSPSRLLRVFKSEVGISLVEHRNRLRLERFLGRVDQGAGNLLEAALDAGFGSYAQFHRVFRALLGTTPREYLLGQK
jgi:AraC-like DNA-binding protein